MGPNQRLDAFGNLLRNSRNAKQLDDALSSMDASSKFGPLLLQAMEQTGRSSTVKKYQDNFRMTEED